MFWEEEEDLVEEWGMEPGQKETAPQVRSKNVLHNKRRRHDPKSAPQAIKIAHTDKQEKEKT